MAYYCVAFAISIVLMICFHLSQDRVGENKYKLILKYKGVRINQRKTGAYLTILGALPIIVCSGIRYFVGTDYYSVYWNGYLAISDGLNRVSGSTVKMELGYYWFNRFLQLFSDSPIFFFVITSIIVYGCIYYAIVRDSVSPVVSVSFFLLSGLFFTSLNIVRQYLTIAIVLVLFVYIYKRKFIFFIFGVIILSFIHLSVLLVIPLYFIYDMKITPLKGVGIIVICFAVSNFLYQIFYYILVNTRYSYYFGNVLYVKDIDVSGIFYALLISAIAFLSYNGIINMIGNRGQFYFNVLIVFDVIVAISMKIELANRIAMFFRVISIVITLPLALKVLPVSKGLRRVTLVFFYVLFSLATVYMYYFKGNAGVFPYQTIFSRSM